MVPWPRVFSRAFPRAMGPGSVPPSWEKSCKLTWPKYGLSLYFQFVLYFPYPLWEADGPEPARRQTPAPRESSLIHPQQLLVKCWPTPMGIPPLSPPSLDYLPCSKGCSRSQESLGRWHQWWHKVTLGLKPKVGGWVGSRWAQQLQSSQQQSCQHPAPREQGAGLICQAVRSASRGGTRKQNKNKKVNYLWLFLNKYPNWPGRILRFGGREKKEEKTPNQPNPTDTHSLSCLPFPLSLALVFISYRRQ